MVVALGIVVVLVVSGVDSLARSFADWRVSANGATVAMQQAEQVRINARTQVELTQIGADVAVEMAEINSETAVKLAEINADTTKKTSGTFVVFYLVRGLMWATGIGIVVIVAALWLARGEA